MEGLVKYLARHKNLKPPHGSTVKIVITIIKDEFGITLTKKNISIKRNGIFLSCHPVVRSEIVRNTTQILHILNNKYNIRLSSIH